MIKHKNQSSSKFYPEIPCVISKSLINKYQRNKKIKTISHLTIPICGDKGKQIKLEGNGIRIPAIFKKEILPVFFPLPISGFVRQVEFFRRKGVWYASVCYNTPMQPRIQETGIIGVDINSVGNNAVMADIQTGKVFKYGISPAATKANMRNRRSNLQKAGKFRLLSKLRLKQSRRMSYENHRTSRSIVDYATKHCRAVAIENLDSVRKSGSKIRHYSEKNQWAYAQLATFIRYKCALRGIPVIAVNPAYTSQTCCRCGEIHKPDGKKFVCPKCGRTEHRDANAAFNIGMRGRAMLSDDILSVVSPGHIGVPQTEKEVVLC
jgi:IS605 OrfB family transposase